MAAVRKLDGSEAFGVPEISPGLVTEEFQILSPFAAVCYEEVVGSYGNEYTVVWQTL